MHRVIRAAPALLCALLLLPRPAAAQGTAPPIQGVTGTIATEGSRDGVKKAAGAAARGVKKVLPGGKVDAQDPLETLIEELGLHAALAWGGLEILSSSDVSWREAIAAAGVGVTGARAGIAATGTLLLPCGPGQPRSTHIIPPAHVCLVRAADLVATIEDAIALQGGAPHPSNMSWVSGPSRTADLEMRQTIGVHGPKSVDVIVISG